MMTATTLEELGRRRIAEVAREYTRKGYDVVIRPGADELPEALCSYGPDLLARRGDEKILVEVKAPSSLEHAEQVQRLKHLVSRAPGWTVELVLFDPGDLPSPEGGARNLNEDEIDAKLRDAEALLGQDRVEAALLLAWSVTEAVLRRLAEHWSVSLRKPDPLSLMTMLTSEGAATREEYRTLVRALTARNAVAHGYVSAELNTSLVAALLQVVRRLVTEELDSGLDEQLAVALPVA